MSTLQDKIKEQAYYVEVLGLWQVVRDAGITIADVKTFTFRPEFLTREQKRQLCLASYAAQRDVSKHWHNCVRMKDDTLKPIPLTARPKCPPGVSLTT